MTANQIWPFVLAITGILGIYLAGSRNLYGWLVSFLTQILWIIFAIVTNQLGFIVSAVFYGWVYGRNYIRWKRESAKADTAKS